jgi:acetolactate synthase I/II/III large subunit
VTDTDSTRAAPLADRPTADGATSSRMVTGAELLLRSLARHGVARVFVNLGTDYAPVVETLAALRRDGVAVPELVLCQHEQVALAAAQAHAQVTEQPQAVFVHADVGTLNLGGALHNASRARVPVVIVAGLSPVTTRGELPGSRSSGVQILQDVPDQAGIVRPYVKWHGEVRVAQHIPQVVARAFQVAASEPQGPTYLLVPREPLEEHAPLTEPLETQQTPRPAVPQADALECLADWLAEADRPLLVTAYAGRDRAAVESLQALAEVAGAGIAEAGPFAWTNVDTSHPHYVGAVSDALLAEADLLVLVDVDVPWVPALGGPAPGCRIAHLDIDPVKAHIPLSDVRSDLLMQARAAAALDALAGLAQARIPATTSRRRSERLAGLRARWDEQRARAVDPTADGELTPALVAHAVDRLLGDRGVVLSEAVSNTPAVVPQLRRGGGRRLMGSGGGSLGWGGGAALGVKLARPGDDVVWLCGDGTFVFSNPTAVYWGARRYAAPFLTVILDNAGWHAIRSSTLQQHPTGVAQQRDDFPSSFAPEADLTLVARSAGAQTWIVEDAGALEAVLRQGLEATRAGTAAVVRAKLAQRA